MQYEPLSSTRPESKLARFAGRVVAHRRMVGLLWLAIAAAGVVLVSPIAGRLTASTSMPGLASYQAGQAIAKIYGAGGNSNVVVAVVTLPGGRSVRTEAGERDAAAALAPIYADRTLQVMAYPAASDPRLVSSDGRSALGVIFEGATGPTSTQIAARIRAVAPSGVAVSATSLGISMPAVAAVPACWVKSSSDRSARWPS